MADDLKTIIINDLTTDLGELATPKPENDAVNDAVNLLAQGQKDTALSDIQTIARSMKDGGNLEAATTVYRAFARALVRLNHAGCAAHLIDELARWHQYEKQDKELASAIYETFADQLAEAGLYGWAASRYYDAAMAYIERGNIAEASEVLWHAWVLFDTNNRQDDYWMSRLGRHLEVLTSEGTATGRITSLQWDFKKDSRHDWVNSCEEGLNWLRSGKKAFESSRWEICDPPPNPEKNYQFLNKELYGWMVSIYYRRACEQTKQGNIDGARQELNEASDSITGLLNQNKITNMWAGHVKAYIKALEDRNFTEQEKLEILKKNFTRDNRYDWVKACKEGIQALAMGAGTLPQPSKPINLRR